MPKVAVRRSRYHQSMLEAGRELLPGPLAFTHGIAMDAPLIYQTPSRALLDQYLIDSVDGPDLIAWRGHGVVILAFPESHPARWVVARGWRRGDVLTDVRRWVYPTRLAASHQVRRLVGDATSRVVPA